ncbi:MAG: InlB B-repeat-containing protein, partial [Thermoplasmata archaeon]
MRAYTDPVTQTNSSFEPSVAFGPGGALSVAFLATNLSSCPFGGYSVCSEEELLASSPDNGSTFGRYFQVTGNETPTGITGEAAKASPQGEYATLLSAGGRLFLAWTDALCPGVTGSSYCAFPARNAVSEVVVSTLGVGPLSLTIQETGLPPGTPWYAEVLGNGAWTNGSSLTFSGIPDGENLTFAVMPSLPLGYGVRFGAGSPSLRPPFAVVANRSVSVAYTKQYLLVVATVPAYPSGAGETGYCDGPYTSSTSYFGWNSPSCPTINYNVSTLPGRYWETPGRGVTLSVTPNSLYCGATAGGSCYSTVYSNLTFLSWVGSGSGSSSSLGLRVSPTMNGPVNETASFQTNGWCEHTYGSYGNTTTCYQEDTPIVFRESGLPAHTAWKLSAWNGSNATTLSGTTDSLSLTGSLSSGLVDFAAWLVPGSAGRYYVPTPSVASPVELPIENVVTIDYTLENLTGLSFGEYLFAPALAATDSWSYSIDGFGAGSATNRTGPTALAVGSHQIDAEPVYFTTDTGFAPAAVESRPLLVGSTWKNTTGPSQTITIDSPVMTFIDFVPEALVEAEPSGRGTVSPSSSWVLLGEKVNLTERPGPGYQFDDWSGFGAGAKNSTAPEVVISPLGPVTEIAVFQPRAASTWNVTVDAQGVPAAVPVTLVLGGKGYTGPSGFNVSGLPTASYSWTAPTVLPEAANLTRYVLTGFNSTWGNSSAPLAIAGDGLIVLDFTAEFVVTPQSQGGGAIGMSS